MIEDFIDPMGGLPTLLPVMKRGEAGALFEKAGKVKTALETAFLGDDLDRKSGIDEESLRLAQTHFEQILVRREAGVRFEQPSEGGVADPVFCRVGFEVESPLDGVIDLATGFPDQRVIFGRS